jgi:succinate dehydrogenase flavin-adding protein (antitoxin of CptAB toxin-antitoxin module)
LIYSGIGRGRGLNENDDSATQIFELVIPKIMRHELNKIYMERIRGILTQNQVMNTFVSKPVPELQMDDYDNL